MRTLLLPECLQRAIVWTDKTKNGVLIALDPLTGSGEPVQWLRANGQPYKIGRYKNLVVVDYRCASWLVGELRCWQLPSQGSRTPSNYVKW